MGALLAGRTLLMTLAPYFGHLADHSGPRRWLMLGYAVLAGGMAMFGFAQGLAIAAAGIVLLGLSDAIITPLMQAYVSEQAPAAMRGRALAVVKYSWAISGIVMVSLIGWLIEFAGWQVPFRVLSLAALLAVAAFAFMLPADRQRSAQRPLTLRAGMGGIARDRSALAAVLLNATLFLAVETIFVVWGAHLELNFGFNPAQVGSVALLIGLAELAGSIVSSVIVDRAGKRHSVMGGLLFFIVVMAAMPLLDSSLPALIAGLKCLGLLLYRVHGGVYDSPLWPATASQPRHHVCGGGDGGGRQPQRHRRHRYLAFRAHRLRFAAMLYGLAGLIVAALLLWRWVEERDEG